MKTWEITVSNMLWVEGLKKGDTGIVSECGENLEDVAILD